MTRPDPPEYIAAHPDWGKPVAEPEPETAWRLVSGKRCRAGAGYHSPACGKPSVAEMNRRTWRGRDRWWAYCGEHLYGRWIEDGRVWVWELRKDEAT